MLPRSNETVRDLAWRILKIIPQQYRTIFLACDSYKGNSIKNVERIGRDSGLKYLLKSPDMIMLSEFSIYVKNGENKTTLLNLIKQVYVEDKTKLQDKVIYFSAEKSVQMALVF